MYMLYIRPTQLCQYSRGVGEWSVAEGVLAALVTASFGNEKICRRLLRVALDQLVDAAEDRRPEQDSDRDSTSLTLPALATVGTPSMGLTIDQSPLSHGGPASSREKAVSVELGLDQIDEIGLDGVLRESTGTLSRSIQEEARKTCSALATSLLQTLGPFNYVRNSTTLQPN